jgi:uncharacterized protein
MIVTSSLDLPRWTHVPGMGGEPDRAPLEAAKERVRRPVRGEAWESDEAYCYGAALCVRGFFWEAHEVWEAVWKACLPNSRERLFLQALIQLANAALKIRMGRQTAALRLLAQVGTLLDEIKLGEADATFMGIGVRRLRAAVHEAVESNDRPAAIAAALALLKGAGALDMLR